MPRVFALAAVLSVRQQKEVAEERELAARNAELQQVRSALARLEQELALWAETRAGEVNALFPAAHHQASYAQARLLREAEADLREQLRSAEAMRAEQLSRYMEARRDREMLTDLQQKHESAWNTQLQSREQRRIDDLFAARRPRH